jgi:hypothetical protein
VAGAGSPSGKQLKVQLSPLAFSARVTKADINYVVDIDITGWFRDQFLLSESNASIKPQGHVLQLVEAFFRGRLLTNPHNFRLEICPMAPVILR